MISFKAGSTIRHIKTGRPFLVVQHFRGAVMVSELDSTDTFVEPKLILERDYERFDQDFNFNQKDKEDVPEFEHMNLAQL